MIRRAAYAQGPRCADPALQRFLMGRWLPGLARDQLTVSIEGNVVRLASVEGAPRQVQRAWEPA